MPEECVVEREDITLDHECPICNNPVTVPISTTADIDYILENPGLYRLCSSCVQLFLARITVWKHGDNYVVGNDDVVRRCNGDDGAIERAERILNHSARLDALGGWDALEDGATEDDLPACPSPDEDQTGEGCEHQHTTPVLSAVDAPSAPESGTQEPSPAQGCAGTTA